MTCLDENDTSPTFKLDEISLSLSESYLPGHALGSVTAEDADSANSNGGLTYSLGLEAQKLMSIDSKTGAITLTKPIDREQQSEVQVEVIVTDGVHTNMWKKTIEVSCSYFLFKPTCFNHVNSSLQVEDVNDNAPVFDPPHFSFDVPETATRGAVVGRIHAEDADASTFARVSYRLISEYGSDTFQVDPTSGVITLAGSNAAVLDHEKAEHYVLVAAASDGGSPPLTSTATVYINVIDVNDNPPQLEKALYSVSVPEDAAIGTVLEKIVASDADSGKNVKSIIVPYSYFN